MSARLLLSIITTLIWEATLVALWLWALPAIGIRLHPGLLIALMAILAAYAITSYKLGSRALRRKPVTGMADMVGSKGRVVSPLTPEGMVNIEGALWTARSLEASIPRGEAVEVLRQEGLTLFVRKTGGEKPPTR